MGKVREYPAAHQIRERAAHRAELSIKVCIAGGLYWDGNPGVDGSAWEPIPFHLDMVAQRSERHAL